MRALPLILGSILLGGCFVRHERVTYTQPGVYPVTSDEAIAMTEAGYADSSILKNVEDNGVEANPDADAIVRMKASGVSDLVINAMQEAPVRKYQAPVEHREVYYTDYTPQVIGGAAIVGGLILGSRYSHHHHGHHHHKSSSRGGFKYRRR